MSVRKVFLSYCSEVVDGNSEILDRACEAIVELKLLPIEMRRFSAYSSNVREYCANQVSDCDIFVMIVGSSIGKPDVDDGKSRKTYQEFEYEVALKKGKEILVFEYVQDAQSQNSEAERLSKRITVKHGMQVIPTPAELGAKLRTSLHESLELLNRKDRMRRRMLGTVSTFVLFMTLLVGYCFGLSRQRAVSIEFNSLYEIAGRKSVVETEVFQDFVARDSSIDHVNVVSWQWADAFAGGKISGGYLCSTYIRFR